MLAFEDFACATRLAPTAHPKGAPRSRSDFVRDRASSSTTALSARTGPWSETAYGIPRTRAAVTRFQAAYGLQVDGIVGPQTLGALAKAKAERVANEDPRPSLEERYGSHAGYVAVVTSAAAKAVAAGFLLAADEKALIAAAEASDVLK